MILTESDIKKLIKSVISEIQLGIIGDTEFGGNVRFKKSRGFEDDDTEDDDYYREEPGDINYIQTLMPASSYSGGSLKVESIPTPSELGFSDENEAYVKGVAFGRRKMSAVLSRMSGDDVAKDAIATACELEGVPPEAMYAMAAIESGGDPKIGCNRFGYCGMYQFGKGAANSVGFQKKEVVGNSPEKILKNCVAAARFMKLNSKTSLPQEIGINFFTLYFCHQQGASGAYSGYKRARKNPTGGLKKAQIENFPGGVKQVTKNRLNFFMAWYGICAGMDQIVATGVPKGDIMSIRPDESGLMGDKGYKKGGKTYKGRSGKNTQGLPNYAPIPGGLNNHRSGQPTYKGMLYAAEVLGVKTVLKLNAGGSDSGGKSLETEKRWAAKVREELNLADDDFKVIKVSAHMGYVYGRGYTRSLQETLPIMRGGDVLVHCSHGADRAGYTVACHLKDIGEMTDPEELYQYTIGFNQWGGDGGKICAGKNLGYAAYLEGFYPLEDWCSNTSGKNPSNRSQCKGCSQKNIERMKQGPQWPRNFK